MSLYEKMPRWVEVDFSIYVAHWNNTIIANEEDMLILQEILQGLCKRSVAHVETLQKELLALGEPFDKPLSVINSHNPEKRMEWVQAKKVSRLLTDTILNLRRESHDGGLLKYKFCVFASIPLKDAEWYLRSHLLTQVFELIGFHADNMLDKKIEEEENGPLVHEREMYYMHIKGVRDAMERLVRGHDQWNFFSIKF